MWIHAANSCEDKICKYVYLYETYINKTHIADKTEFIYILDLHSSLGESDTL